MNGPDRKLRMPARRLLLWELRVVPELVSSFLPRPFGTALPRGSGEPVLVVPGFGADDLAVALLTRRLRTLGYHARSWDLGRNTGNLKKLQPLLVDQVQRLADSRGAKVRLVGWSLGGAMSRDIAREHPQWVAQVVTLGSPVIGGAKFTAVGRSYQKRGLDLDRMAAAADARETGKTIPVPVTALYDRHDGIVDWAACIDRHNGHVRHIEVQCSHLGMVVDRRVFGIIANALAQT
jgi:pimeloyl-ACP methyl ester carboxylesterase